MDNNRHAATHRRFSHQCDVVQRGTATCFPAEGTGDRASCVQRKKRAISCAAATKTIHDHAPRMASLRRLDVEARRAFYLVDYVCISYSILLRPPPLPSHIANVQSHRRFSFQNLHSGRTSAVAPLRAEGGEEGGFHDLKRGVSQCSESTACMPSRPCAYQRSGHVGMLSGHEPAMGSAISEMWMRSRRSRVRERVELSYILCMSRSCARS